MLVTRPSLSISTINGKIESWRSFMPKATKSEIYRFLLVLDSIDTTPFRSKKCKQDSSLESCDRSVLLFRRSDLCVSFEWGTNHRWISWVTWFMLVDPSNWNLSVYGVFGSKPCLLEVTNWREKDTRNWCYRSQSIKKLNDNYTRGTIQAYGALHPTSSTNQSAHTSFVDLEIKVNEHCCVVAKKASRI